MFTPMQFGCMSGCIPPETITEVWHQKSQVSDDGEWITDFELLQYTGLKDKNGKEIYEGDVLRRLQRNKDKTPNGSKYMLITYRQLGYSGIGFNVSVGCQHSEIVGNIYENPELLPRKD